MVTTTVTAKFHNPSRKRRREWQRATHPYRDTKPFCIDAWERGDFDKSVTTASIDNDLYSAIQNQAIREAKADHQKDGVVSYRSSQPFALNNQNWEIDTTENSSIVVSFPCISGWLYTPIEVQGDIADAVQRLVDDKANKTRLQVYRRGNDWFCTFNVKSKPHQVAGHLSGLTSAATTYSRPVPTARTSRCLCVRSRGEIRPTTLSFPTRFADSGGCASRTKPHG